MGRAKQYFTDEERKARRAEYMKQWRESHKEEIAQWKKEYYQDHKAEIAEYSKQWREKNPEYYQAHKEEIVEHQKEYNKTHKDEIAKYKKKYRQAHKDEIAEQKKQYRKTPMGRACYLVGAYKHSDKEANRGECTLTPQWIVENIFTKPCAHCGITGWEVIGCNRLDNSKPHTENNVEPCCALCNCRLPKRC